MFYGLNNFFKKALPKRLFYRSLFIVVTPIILLQITITIVFFDSLWIKANKGMTRSLVGEVQTMFEVYKNGNENEQEMIINLYDKNFDFVVTIKENEILGLLGPNGSGKTTTIGMMLGLLKPSNGEILIDGKKIEENRIETLQKINFISPYIELPKKLTVKQNLIVYCRLYNVLDIKSRIEYLVEKLRLEDLLNRVTGELSSGQKNRASLAKALINNPERH